MELGRVEASEHRESVGRQDSEPGERERECFAFERVRLEFPSGKRWNGTW